MFCAQLFAEAGVMAIEHADFEGVERLAAVTGGATASTFDHPELAVLGECAKIEEVRAFLMKNAAYDGDFGTFLEGIPRNLTTEVCIVIIITSVTGNATDSALSVVYMNVMYPRRIYSQ